uniref:Uncharacterized protein n=1 Tax=Glossina pallidipes TaxID=7398 RepID=A0A1A9ZPG1_GLOPL
MNSIHRNCMSLMSVIDAIMYESNSHLAPGNTSAGLYPNRSEVDTCRSFFAALVTEHSREDPWLGIYSATNVLLRKIYFLLLEVIVVGMMTLMIMYVYNIKWVWPEKEEIDASVRPLKKENAELAKPLVRLEQLVTPDGNSILVLKMGYKRNLPNSIASNKLQNFRGLLRLRDTHLQTKHKGKSELSKKIMRLLAKNSSKLITFDECRTYKEHLSTSPLRFNFSSLASRRPGQRSSERNCFISSKYKTTMPSMLPVCVARRSKQKRKN